MPPVRTALPIAAAIRWIAPVLFLASCAHDAAELVEHAALDGSTWNFRGTPNGWAATAMTPITGTSRHETCQQFGGVASPRFKIDHYGDWTESYPAQDYGVADNASYHIEFDATTHAITVQPVASCGAAPADTWYFRGTSNLWGSTAMTPVTGTSRHETCQRFTGVANPRFKIDHHGDWAESYPAQDYVVANDTSQRITFDAATHAVTVQAVASCTGSPADTWYFRGTPNSWTHLRDDAGRRHVAARDRGVVRSRRSVAAVQDRSPR